MHTPSCTPKSRKPVNKSFITRCLVLSLLYLLIIPGVCLAQNWGEITAKSCSKTPGYKEYSAILWNIPSGKPWEDICNAMSATFKDNKGVTHYFEKPSDCDNVGSHIWGIWEVPDSECGTPANPNLILKGTSGEMEGPPRAIRYCLNFDKNSSWDGISILWDGEVMDSYSNGYFMIPVTASEGIHTLQLRDANGNTGNKIGFNVIAPLPYSGPIIKNKQLIWTTFSGGKITTTIFLNVQNADRKPIIKIDGNVISHEPNFPYNFAWPAEYCVGVPPPLLGRPMINMSLLRIGGPGPGKTFKAGSKITITVSNSDGKSDDIEVQLPSSNADLDSDFDGLLDEWEDKGYDFNNDGIIDVDLPAMGANKYIPDLFVEVDIMKGLANPPDARVFQSVERIFGNVMTYFRTEGSYAYGYRLHFDYGQGGPFTEGGVTIPKTENIDFSMPTDAAGNVVNFYDIRKDYFKPARDKIFRYAVWAKARFGTSSSGAAYRPGKDMIISFDTWSSPFQTNRAKAGTLMHELGHNLGIKGDDERPNHISVMSYCSQIGEKNSCAVICQGCWVGSNQPYFSYSYGMVADLDENNLNEQLGLCLIPQDWNKDGLIEKNVKANIDGTQDGKINYEVLVDQDEWHNLEFKIPKKDMGSVKN